MAFLPPELFIQAVGSEKAREYATTILAVLEPEAKPKPKKEAKPDNEKEKKSYERGE